MASLHKSPYQLVPLTKLLRNGLGSVLICDGVGVGKTISAGFILTYLTTLLRVPALVVCPPSLTQKWFVELKSKFQLDAVVIGSTEELGFTVDYWNRPTDNSRVFVLPSSLLGTTKGSAFSGPIIFDEIHNYRNADAQAWAAAAALATQAPFRVGLSATPINNGVADLAAEFAVLLNLNVHVARAVVEDLWRPGRQQAFYPLMTRFSKEQLGIHFAKREVHDVHIDVSEAYRQQVATVIKSIRGRRVSESMYRDEITYFRLAASSARAFNKSTGTDSIVNFEKFEDLNRILQVHGKEPIIIFCEFEETARALEQEIDSRPSFVVTGSVATFLRADILEQFRKSENGVLLMTSVGAEGLDLQFCSTLVNYDLNWNPMVLEQRIGRIDRIGQSKPVIQVYNCIVKGSIDERIVEVLGRKLGLVEGSILEPATVLGGSGQLQEGPLFSPASFEKELHNAQALARATQLTAQIIPEDYDVLESVDARFCDPKALRKVATADFGIPWLTKTPASTEWLESLTRSAEKFTRVLETYSD